jgi:hypothetical protein
MKWKGVGHERCGVINWVELVNNKYMLWTLLFLCLNVTHVLLLLSNT